jgi:hypothetical protein
LFSSRHGAIFTITSTPYIRVTLANDDDKKKSKRKPVKKKKKGKQQTGSTIQNTNDTSITKKVPRKKADITKDPCWQRIDSLRENPAFPVNQRKVVLDEEIIGEEDKEEEEVEENKKDESNGKYI